MTYQRCGRSGLQLPGVSLGLWHNFGATDPFDVGRDMVLRAFDLGITHFDLAAARGQRLAQMAVAWVLRDRRMTSALIGASRVSQVEDAVAASANRSFSDEELQQIDRILTVA